MAKSRKKGTKIPLTETLKKLLQSVETSRIQVSKGPIIQESRRPRDFVFRVQLFRYSKFSLFFSFLSVKDLQISYCLHNCNVLKKNYILDEL